VDSGLGGPPEGTRIFWNVGRGGGRARIPTSGPGPQWRSLGTGRGRLRGRKGAFAAWPVWAPPRGPADQACWGASKPPGPSSTPRFSFPDPPGGLGSGAKSRDLGGAPRGNPKPGPGSLVTGWGQRPRRRISEAPPGQKIPVREIRQGLPRRKKKTAGNKIAGPLKTKKRGPSPRPKGEGEGPEVGVT